MKALIFIFCFFLSLLGNGSLGQAQALLVQEGTATVSIPRENLALAEKNAIKVAQQNILKALLPQIISQETLRQAESVIQQRVLKTPERFIESTRIVSTSRSEDFTEFTIVLEAHIFKPKLVAFLQNLNLATQSAPLQPLIMLFDPDDSLMQSTQKNELLLVLNRFLKPYKIQVQKTMALPPRWIRSLQNSPKASLPPDIAKQARSTAFLFVNFRPDKLPTSEKKSATSARLQLRAYRAYQGRYLGETQVSQTFSTWSPQSSVDALFQKASAKWNPMISAMIRSNQQRGSSLQIKLTGLPSPQQEQDFVRRVFQSNPQWKQVQPYRLTAKSAIYQGFYSGSKSSIVPWLKKQNLPDYKILSAQWKARQLNLKLQWVEPMTNLTDYVPRPNVNRLIRKYNLPTPTQQVPLKRLKTTYALPTNTPVYDYLRNRGDSTLFKINLQNSSKPVVGNWYRIERTNLSPTLSVYDAQKNLVARYAPQKNGKIKFNYQPSQGESFFYVKISDQVGHTTGESGSYLFVHYLIKISS